MKTYLVPILMLTAYAAVADEYSPEIAREQVDAVGTVSEFLEAEAKAAAKAESSADVSKEVRTATDSKRAKLQAWFGEKFHRFVVGESEPGGTLRVTGNIPGQKAKRRGGCIKGTGYPETEICQNILTLAKWWNEDHGTKLLAKLKRRDEIDKSDVETYTNRWRQCSEEAGSLELTLGKVGGLAYQYTAQAVFMQTAIRGMDTAVREYNERNNIKGAVAYVAEPPTKTYCGNVDCHDFLAGGVCTTKMGSACYCEGGRNRGHSGDTDCADSDSPTHAAAATGSTDSPTRSASSSGGPA